MADLATRFGSWKERAHRALATARNVRARAERPVELIVSSAEIQGAAFLTGMLKGRMGDPEIGGVPIDLVGGLAFLGAGLLLGTHKLSDHAINLGNGVTASYTSQAGYGIGLEMAAKANNTTTAVIMQRRAAGQLDNGTPDPARRRLA